MVSMERIDLAEKMHTHEASTGVDRFILKKMISSQNSWIRKKLVLWCVASQRQKGSPRGPNRHVDVLRYRGPAIFLEEAEYECMQDTDQKQPTIQLESRMITFRLMNGNAKTSLPMTTVKVTSGKLRSRKLSVNWYDMNAETEKQVEQFIEARDYVPKGWKLRIHSQRLDQ